MATKKLYENFSKTLINEIHKCGSMKQTGVSLRYMLEFGSISSERNMIIAAQFLHKELPIRIARRAIELDSLPYSLSENPAVLKVCFFFISVSYILRIVLYVKGLFFRNGILVYLYNNIKGHVTLLKKNFTGQVCVTVGLHPVD